ncbi:MAG: hypothetical protein BWY49_00864 [Candidatus Omnitrophica bacterium ADurb.Bin314]|nr:MAG: hypothetical protein BWY49_00864 [Candidatus Omnitrophica bacterium ADurb.Bin314]
MTLKRVRSIIKVTTNAAGVGARKSIPIVTRKRTVQRIPTWRTHRGRSSFVTASAIRFRAAGRKTTQSPVRTIQLPIAMPRILK